MDADYVKSLIDRTREKIGRTVTFYTPVAGQDTDFIASGLYNPLTFSGYIPTLEATEVLARIHWADEERITATPGGKYYVGDCTLGIDPSYHALAQKCMNSDAGYISVPDKLDGLAREVTIQGIDAVGVMSVNRLRLICKSKGTRPAP